MSLIESLDADDLDVNVLDPLEREFEFIELFNEATRKGILNPLDVVLPACEPHVAKDLMRSIEMHLHEQLKAKNDQTRNQIKRNMNIVIQLKQTTCIEEREQILQQCIEENNQVIIQYMTRKYNISFIRTRVERLIEDVMKIHYYNNNKMMLGKLELNAGITLHFIEKHLNDWHWDWGLLVLNTNMTIAFIDKHCNKPWDMHGNLSRSKLLTDDFLLRHVHNEHLKWKVLKEWTKWDVKFVVHENIINPNISFKCLGQLLRLYNVPITNTIHTYCKSTKERNLTGDLMEAYAYATDDKSWTFLSMNPYVSLELLEEYIMKPWNWYLVSQHNQQLTEEFVLRHRELCWNFFYLATERFSESFLYTIYGNEFSFFNHMNVFVNAYKRFSPHFIHQYFDQIKSRLKLDEILQLLAHDRIDLKSESFLIERFDTLIAEIQK